MLVILKKYHNIHHKKNICYSKFELFKILKALAYLRIQYIAD